LLPQAHNENANASNMSNEKVFFILFFSL